jgi:hypothetical protein
VDHGLLVPDLQIGELGPVLLERLSEAGDVAVAEDAEHRRNEAPCMAVPAAVLGLEVPNDGLCDRQADGLGSVAGHGLSSSSWLVQ